MAVYQFVFDDFNDNSFDTVFKWTYAVNAPSITESGGKLNTPSALYTNGPNVVFSNMVQNYDISKGRLAYQVTKSGTTDSNTYLYFGMIDVNFNYLSLFGRSTAADIQVAGNSTGTGTATQVETTIGLGPSLPAGIWLGWDYNVATKTYSLSKSTDGVTWTQIWKFVVTAAGAFNYKQCRFMMGTTCYAAAPTNFSAAWDNPSYFATDTYLKVKYRTTSSTWADASVKYRSTTSTWKRPITRFKVSGGYWGRPNP